ncbi:nucleotide exchange factor GrpE [Arcobacter sp. 31_11_sub10_T18]|nr:nucleotide exchange factor GrpE [Arcobacter sp. 31_11_sub10_T18]
MSEAKTEEVLEEQVETAENETVETNEEVETEVEVTDPVSDLELKLKESEEKYLRVHADFENIKKRLEREKYQAIDYASEKFAKDLLAPIDSLEMAMSSATADLSAEELLEKLKEGINLTIKNFNTAFEKHDISLVETDGHFDPNFHNAIMQVEDENKEEGDIVQVMQKGYKYKERLLRPAMVSICKK